MDYNLDGDVIMGSCLELEMSLATSLIWKGSRELQRLIASQEHLAIEGWIKIELAFFPLVFRSSLN